MCCSCLFPSFGWRPGGREREPVEASDSGVGPGFPGQALEFEVVRAVVPLPGIGFDVGDGRDF